MLFIFIGGRGTPEHYDTETRWCCMLVWCIIIFFCYLIGVRRWFPSFGGFALELAELADFGREAVLVQLTPTWHGRRDTSAPKRGTRIKRAMKGTRSWGGGSDQHQPNTCNIFIGFLRRGGVQEGDKRHDLPPSPGHWAPGSYGAIGVGWVATASGAAIAVVLLGGVSLAGF